MGILKGLDYLVDRTGRVMAWLVVLIILTMTYEVVSRYVFDAPTFWSFDITYMLGAVLFLFSAPSVLLHRGHVRVDLFYARFSTKLKTLIDVVLTPLLFFPALGILTQQAWRAAFRALEVGETSMFGIWEPTTIPLRFAIALGFSLLSLAGICWFLRGILLLSTRKELAEDSHD
ncbi:MAG: TRAP transporter small permease subunit [Dehalococcoidales bacterium]|jgi:TRAP-type mannitol/chloroaromatic compound transport system permease small subunit|nr:TRAP transporter small permease subunit [Dehalococcoidales bacterium]MDP6825237.1 TRAP transporter small permease subunit [Dehalococcoidales bacterium]